MLTFAITKQLFGFILFITLCLVLNELYTTMERILFTQFVRNDPCGAANLFDRRLNIGIGSKYATIFDTFTVAAVRYLLTVENDKIFVLYYITFVERFFRNARPRV